MILNSYSPYRLHPTVSKNFETIKNLKFYGTFQFVNGKSNKALIESIHTYKFSQRVVVESARIVLTKTKSLAMPVLWIYNRSLQYRSITRYIVSKVPTSGHSSKILRTMPVYNYSRSCTSVPKTTTSAFCETVHPVHSQRREQLLNSAQE